MSTPDKVAPTKMREERFVPTIDLVFRYFTIIGEVRRVSNAMELFQDSERSIR